MEKIKISDLLDYRMIHSLSGSENHLLCIQTQMDRQENNYHSDLMEVDRESLTLRPVTSSGKVSSFVYEDEDTVLFSAVRKESDEAKKFHKKTMYYRLSLKGGEAMPAFSVPYDVIDLYPIEHSDWIVLKVCEKLHALDPEKASREDLEDEQDYVVLHEVPFVTNGAGFTDSERSSLILWNKVSGENHRLTEEFCDVQRVAVTGHRIIYTCKCWQDVLPQTAELLCYDLDERKKEVILPSGQLKISDLSAEGDTLMFMATDGKGYGNGTSHDFYRCDLNTLEVEKVLDYEYSVGSCVNSDVRYGSGKTFQLKEGILYFTSTVGYNSELYTLTGNTIEKKVAFNGAISGFDLSGKDIFVCGMEPGKLQEIHRCGESAAMSHVSDCLKDKAVQPVLYMPFVNRCGMKMDGWLIRPVDYDENKTYPAILDIHGGPRTTYGECFFHEMQVWASEGYFVFFCNHRGSDGYGDEFADLRLKYGTVDYEDIMDFTDYILQQVPQIDPKRMGVTGGSYGGYMTNWMITQTDRFACACAQRSISNWISDYGTSGISYDDDLHLGAKPWKDVENMWDHSPLKYVDRCTTPTLFIHSFEDYTCAVSQAMEMFTALKMLKVETRACLFKGENHSLSRSGKPRHRIRRLSEITEWMNQHCK